MTKKDFKIREPIKKWPANERPREILLEKGPDYLSDAGLIAILLRTGTARKDVVQLARELLDRFGGLSGLLRAPKKDLEDIKGMGPAKIAQLMAALEIIKRQLRDSLKKSEMKTFENPQIVFDYLQSSMGAYKKEVFKVLYLNVDQTRFLRVVKSVFLEKARRREALALADLYEEPFDTFGVDAADRLFKKEELEEIVKFFNQLPVS